MAQALGYVTKTEVGNFQGTLNLGGANRINIVANDNKETDKQPDFRIVDNRSEAAPEDAPEAAPKTDLEDVPKSDEASNETKPSKADKKRDA